MPRISTEERIKQLEAKIADIKAKAERKKVKANPSIKLMKAALKSLERAIGATEDAVLRKSLDDARSTVSACLALCGVKTSSASGALTPTKRGRPRATTTDNGQMGPDANDLLGYLKKNPGAKSEQISAALSTDAVALRKALQPLMGDGKVRTEGQRRGTRYFTAV